MQAFESIINVDNAGKIRYFGNIIALGAPKCRNTGDCYMTIQRVSEVVERRIIG